MAKMECKSFDKPEETRAINKGKIEVVKLGDVTAMRVRFEPGWKWSECVKPVVRMDDGTEAEFGAGDVGVIPPGHDAWLIGNEAFVGIDFQGGAIYAKPQH